MQEVLPGLFAAPEEMPCSPRDIHITPYESPCNLDRAERQEAAARILSFSTKHEGWVGVTWKHLLEVMSEEREKSQWIARALRGVERAKKVHKWFRAFTFGFFQGFDEDSVEKVCALAREGLPKTAIYFTHYDFVLRGITELVEMGMIREVVEGGLGLESHTYFPTPVLISLVMKDQRVKVGEKQPEPVAQ